MSQSPGTGNPLGNPSSASTEATDATDAPTATDATDPSSVTAEATAKPAPGASGESRQQSASTPKAPRKKGGLRNRLTRWKFAVVSKVGVTLGLLLIRMLGLSWRFRLNGEALAESLRTRAIKPSEPNAPSEPGESREGDEAGKGGKQGPAAGLPAIPLVEGPPAPIILAVYHGPHLPLLYRFRGRGTCVVTSQSNDGQVLTDVLHGMGFTTVRGSSSRGASRATRELVRRVEEGTEVAVAVDGPRGPAWKVKPGVLLIAKRTGRPILPVAITPKTFWQFQSWDRFRFPLPFTRITIEAGEPYWVPPDADDATLQRFGEAFQEEMVNLQLRVDRAVKPRVWRRKDHKRLQKKAPRPTLEDFVAAQAAEQDEVKAAAKKSGDTADTP